MEEMCAIYQAMKVYGCKITTTIYYNAVQGNAIYTAPDQPIRAFIECYPPGQALDDFSSLGNWQANDRFITSNKKYCSSKTITSRTAGARTYCTVKKFFHLPSLYGNKLEYKAAAAVDNQISTTLSQLSASPTVVLNCRVGVMVLDNAAAAADIVLTAVTVLTFYCKFWDQKVQVN